MRSTLVLNASHEPQEIVRDRKAVSLILKNKATSLDDSPFFMRAENEIFPIPYVIRLNYMVPRRRVKKSNFSNRGVLVRDKFTCAYCGSHATTIDHVIPRSRGGATSYENCVAACKRCNSQKADKLLRELGWTLGVKPVVPSWYLMELFRAKDEQRETWTPHIAAYDPKFALSLV